MIKGTSQTVGIQNYETMLVTGVVEQGQPIFMTNLYYDELSPSQKIIYDEAMPIVSGSYLTTITNTTAELDVSRLTSDVLVEEPSVIDFETLSEVDKDKLRLLLGLFIELSA